MVEAKGSPEFSLPLLPWDMETTSKIQKLSFAHEKQMVLAGKHTVVVLTGPSDPVAWRGRVGIPDGGPIRSDSQTSGIIQNSTHQEDHRALCKQEGKIKSSPAVEFGQDAS